MYIDISCEILYNAGMLSQEDIQIITDIVSTQMSLHIQPVLERLNSLENKVNAIDKRLSIVEVDVNDIKIRVTKIERKTKALDKKIDTSKAEIIEKIHDFEYSVQDSFRNNQKALSAVIGNSEKKMSEHINKLDDGFHATIQLALSNRKDIEKITDHLDTYSTSHQDAYNTRVAEKRAEEYDKS